MSNGSLNPADLRRLNANVQTLIEWAGSVSGRPEPTAEQIAAVEQLQRTITAANEGRRTEPKMREKTADRDEQRANG